MTGEEAKRRKCFKELQKIAEEIVTRCYINILISAVMYILMQYTSSYLS